MRNIQQLLKAMETIDFFSDFTKEEKEWLCENGFLEEYKPFSHLIIQGEADQTLFVLISGLLDVTKSETPDKPLAELTPGSIFGEVAFFSDHLRTTNVVAKERVLAFKLPKEKFQTMDANMKVKIQDQTIHVLLQRLEHMNATFLRMARLKINN
ncbi:MAG: cyclic nucleotide-binding domain-containing protein [Magnetococcus sp. DMHC-6]